MTLVAESESDMMRANVPGRSSGRGLGWTALAVALAGGVFAWSWGSGGESNVADASPLPVIKAAPAFSLTECRGRSVTGDDLEGTVWVADFIFSRCPGPCPQLSARMRSMQLALADRAGEVKLVSFSLDPKNDTPSVLQGYGRRFKADPSIWWFLTGADDDTMFDLVTEGFLQTAVPGTDEGSIIHSNYFVVVDRQGRIRSYHDGLDPKATKLILRDVEALLSEPVE